MLTTHDVGRRVSVRRQGRGRPHRRRWATCSTSPTSHLEVLHARGGDRPRPAADVTAAKVVPPATPRRGWEVPDVSARRACSASAGPAGRPASASGSATGRCGPTAASPAGPTRRWRSATPARPLAGGARRRVAAWYARTRAARRCCSCRWPTRPTRSMAAAGLAPAARHRSCRSRRSSAVLDGATGPRRPARRGRAPEPSEDWLSLMHDLDEDDPDGARRDPHRAGAGSASPPCAGTTTRSASAGSRSRASGPA